MSIFSNAYFESWYHKYIWTCCICHHIAALAECNLLGPGTRGNFLPILRNIDVSISFRTLPGIWKCLFPDTILAIMTGHIWKERLGFSHSYFFILIRDIQKALYQVSVFTIVDVPRHLHCMTPSASHDTRSGIYFGLHVALLRGQSVSLSIGRDYIIATIVL